jgi:hypothetical protein
MNHEFTLPLTALSISCPELTNEAYTEGKLGKLKAVSKTSLTINQKIL